MRGRAADQGRCHNGPNPTDQLLMIKAAPLLDGGMCLIIRT
jgi:hypothetical protein